MNLGLESDMANPNFSGATNPDSVLTVRFYKRPMQNNFQTEKQGRPIFEDVVFVQIFTPGNDKNIIDTIAHDHHKARFPLQWAHFQNTQGSSEQVVGTLLSQWPLISQSQAEELRALKFFTVENVAGASDEQIGRIGMLAGMAPNAFRERAQRFLSAAKGEADVNAQAVEKKKLEEANAALQAQVTDLSEKLNKVLEKLSDTPAPKRTYTRKPKNEQVAA